MVLFSWSLLRVTMYKGPSYALYKERTMLCAPTQGVWSSAKISHGFASFGIGASGVGGGVGRSVGHGVFWGAGGRGGGGGGSNGGSPAAVTHKPDCLCTSVPGCVFVNPIVNCAAGEAQSDSIALPPVAPCDEVFLTPKQKGVSS